MEYGKKASAKNINREILITQNAFTNTIALHVQFNESESSTLQDISPPGSGLDTFKCSLVLLVSFTAYFIVFSYVEFNCIAIFNAFTFILSNISCSNFVFFLSFFLNVYIFLLLSLMHFLALQVKLNQNEK